MPRHAAACSPSGDRLLVVTRREALVVGTVARIADAPDALLREAGLDAEASAACRAAAAATPATLPVSDR
jgi:hypothetical protein